MKEIVSFYGHRLGETLTVGELRELLDDYPADLPILATWDGGFAALYPDRFSLDEPPHRYMQGAPECLIIDVSEHL